MTAKRFPCAEVVRDPSVKVYKYPLEVADTVDLTMPAGADVLCVQMQDGRPYLWAKVDVEASKSLRRFYVVGTGHPMPVDAKRYVGTFQMASGKLVFHVFEG